MIRKKIFWNVVWLVTGTALEYFGTKLIEAQEKHDTKKKDEVLESEIVDDEEEIMEEIPEE